ncbi:MAG: hypothetical protein NTW50_00790 [Candidatus Berkelbacteria bacterium]|nr:hypothetical protein [Candidatus Berkelbacteria bacterium]
MLVFAGFSFEFSPLPQKRSLIKASARMREIGKNHGYVSEGNPVHATERAIKGTFESWRTQNRPRWPKCRLFTKIERVDGGYQAMVTASTRKGRYQTVGISTADSIPQAVAAAAYIRQMSHSFSLSKNQKTQLVNPTGYLLMFKLSSHPRPDISSGQFFIKK